MLKVRGFHVFFSQGFFPKKGFIGPIGDDLPSLIPIIFALVLFFSAFNYGLSNLNEKSVEFADDLDSLKAARILRSNSYIVDYENFNELCNTVSVKAVKFKAGITELNQGLLDEHGRIQRDSDLFFQDSEGNLFVCSNASDGGLSNDTLFSGRVLVRVYPVAVEVDRGELGIAVMPKQLMVVAWRE